MRISFAHQADPNLYPLKKIEDFVYKANDFFINNESFGNFPYFDYIWAETQYFLAYHINQPKFTDYVKSIINQEYIGGYYINSLFNRKIIGDAPIFRDNKRRIQPKIMPVLLALIAVGMPLFVANNSIKKFVTDNTRDIVAAVRRLL